MTDSNRVGFSNRLNLDRFFFEVREQIYVVVKLGKDFPDYYKGSDIDVFCYDRDKFARQILSVGNCYLDQGFEVEVRNKSESHTFIDFYFDGELDFRFDLYGSLPEYKKIRLKEHYIYSVIENAKVVYREFEGVQYPLYVPSTVDELLLRYVEYIEWYELRPDKIRHLDYITKAIAADATRIGFLDKLHLYTELPVPYYENVSNGVSEFGRAETWLKRIRSVPVRHIPGILFRKLRWAAWVVLRILYRALKSCLPTNVSDWI